MRLRDVARIHRGPRSANGGAEGIRELFHQGELFLRPEAAAARDNLRGATELRPRGGNNGLVEESIRAADFPEGVTARLSDAGGRAAARASMEPCRTVMTGAPNVAVDVTL